MMTLPRIARSVAVAAAAASLTLTGLSTAPAADAAVTVDANTYAGDARDQTNRERTSRSLKALTYSSCLKTYANRQAAAMAKAKKIYHQDLGPILATCKLSTVGENVASGYPSGTATVAGWMNSPGHRANILKTTYRQVTVSAAQDSAGRWYVAQVFGTPR